MKNLILNTGRLVESNLRRVFLHIQPRVDLWLHLSSSVEIASRAVSGVSILRSNKSIIIINAWEAYVVV